MKKSIYTLKQFDYSSKEEFLKDLSKMQNKGYTLINEGHLISQVFPLGYTNEAEENYTASFYKDTL